MIMSYLENQSNMLADLDDIHVEVKYRLFSVLIKSTNETVFISINSFHCIDCF